MHPKELKIPCSWEDRKPCLLDQLLYIPNYYQDHDKVDFELSFFKNDNPIMIEYCSGNGQWIIEKAMSNKEFNWIAVEKDFGRIHKIWNKMKDKNLENLFIVFGEAYIFTHFYLLKDTVSSIFVNYPDPWPKRKHAKNRLI